VKLVFRLSWAAAGKKRFKSEGARLLFEDYAERLARFAPVSAEGALSAPLPSGSRLWLCDSAQGKPLASEAAAGLLRKLEVQGTKELHVAIGPTDGFSAADRVRLKPDLVWSFGPLTLPHELAAAVAAEQVYRAYTIVRGLPYHSGH